MPYASNYPVEPDYGDDLGPAATARDSAVISVRGEWRGSVQGGAVMARRYFAPALIDRMRMAGDLTERQYQVMVMVAARHDEAGFEPRVSGSYAPRGWGHGHDDEAAEHEAITEFRRLLGDVSPLAAWALHTLCLGEMPHPGQMPGLRQVLDLLWVEMGMRDRA